MVLLTPTATKPGASVSPSSFSPLSLQTLPHFSSSGCQQCLGGKLTRFGSVLCNKTEKNSASSHSAQTPAWRQHHRDQSAQEMDPACPSFSIHTLRQPQQGTREGRRAGDLPLQQFATLVLHPAVNYVPFSVTIRANGCRADGNTKWAQPSMYRGAQTMHNSYNTPNLLLIKLFDQIQAVSWN